MNNKEKTRQLIDNKDYIINSIQSGLKTRVEIAQEFGVDRKTVERNYIKWNNGTRNSWKKPTSKYVSEKMGVKFNELTDEACYWLGILASDGNISSTTRVGKHITRTRYRVTLSMTDKDVVYNFSKYMLGKERVYEYFYAKHNYAKPLFVCKVDITEETFNILKSYGITPKKSVTLLISQELLENNNFLRGVIDGDGHIYKRNRGLKGNQYEVGVTTGSKTFAEQLQTSLIKKFGECRIEVDNRGKNPCYRLKITRVQPFYDALETLYKDAPSHMRMERKYEKAMELLRKAN